MILQVPVYFYYPQAIPAQVNSKSGLDCWILKTYQILKATKSELEIHLVDYIPNHGIIIFHKGFFPKEIRPTGSQLFVCAQADYGRHKYAQCHIAQNPYGVSNFRFSKRSFLEEKLFSFAQNYFVAHWNQDEIIKRNSKRGNTFQNVCFYGVTQNFPSELLNSDFKEQLKSENIELHIITDSEKWNDYSETDCVLAIRDFSGKPHYNKPFSKIINSYIAGVPVIAGKESSAVYLKKEKGLHFPIVKSASECYEAILSVKQNYDNERNKVVQDNANLAIFQDEMIVLEWNKILKELQFTFQEWQQSSDLMKKLFYKIRKT